jgi:hypothetical protein
MGHQDNPRPASYTISILVRVHIILGSPRDPTPLARSFELTSGSSEKTDKERDLRRRAVEVSWRRVSANA